MKRRTAIFLGAGSCVLLASALTIAWLLWTESGLRFLVGRIAVLSPVSIQYSEVTGHLLGELEITNVEITGVNPEIRIVKANTSLAPFALLRGLIDLQNLRVESVSVRFVSPPPAADHEVVREEGAPWKFPEPLLPLDLRISNLEITDLQVLSDTRDPVDPFILQRLAASDLSFEGTTWSLSGLQASAEQLFVGGDLSYQASADHKFQAVVKSKWQLNEKSIEIESKIDGNDKGISLVQRLDGLIRGDISGELTDPAGASSLSLQANLDIDDPRLLDERLPPGSLATTLRLNKENGATRLSGTARKAELESGFEFEARLGDLASGLEIRSFILREQGTDSRIGFDGSMYLLAGYPRVNGDLTWTALHWPLDAPVAESVASSPTGAFAVTGEGGKYRLRGEAQLANETMAGTFTSAGEIDLTLPATAFSMNGEWDSLQLRIEPRAFTLQSGRYQIAGDLDDYEFSAGFTASTKNAPAVVLELFGEGSGGNLKLEKLTANSTSGTLNAQGAFNFSGARDFEFSLNARDVNPGAFDQRWPGLLSVRGSASGKFDEEGPELNLQLSELRGQLRGLPVDAQGDARFSRGMLSMADVAGSWGQSRLQARGKLGEKRDFAWQLSIPELSAHTDRGEGSLSSDGRFSGSSAQPQVEAHIDAQNLKYVDIDVQQLQLDMAVDAKNSQASTFRAVAKAVTWKEESLDEMSVDVTGTTSAHSGEVNVTRGTNGLQSRFSGSWTPGNSSGNGAGNGPGSWQGEIYDSLLTLNDGVWRQENTAKLAVRESGAELGTSCLVQDQSRMCLRASVPWSGGAGIDLALTALPISALSTLLPEGLFYAGELSGEAQLVAGEGTARFSVTQARVWQDIANEEQVLLDYENLSATADLANEKLVLEIKGIEPGQRELRFRVSVPFVNWAVTDGPIQGQLQGVMENLSAVSFLFPDLADLRGRLEADLRLGGTVALPDWEGDIVLSDAQAQVPSLGLSLASVSGRVRASGRQLSGEFSVTSGSGSLRLKGEATPGMDGLEGRFTLQGEKFLASELPEARLVLSPDLAIVVAGRSVGVNGKVGVDEARIEPRDLSAAVQRSPDARVMAESGVPVPDASWAITSNVSVSFSDNVFFKGFGLESRIKGSLTVVDAPDAVTTATGELETVDGTYTAYGRELQIRRGRLLFSGGPLANPGLDVMATRKLEAGIEAGVLVRATLKSPEITLYSDPSMAPSQTLSYLLVGQPLADIGSADRQLVSDTATRLASAGGGLLAQQLGRRLGFEDVTIASGSDGEQAALVIGKYLSPKLYASYGVGLFESVNTLRLRYLLSSKWTIRGESGLNQSVDLEYTLER